MYESMDFAQLRAVKAALVAMCALALLVSGCAAPKSSEKQTVSTLSGVVQDVQGNPINGALVSAKAPRGVNSLAPAAASDGRGRFTITDLPASTVVVVTAQAPGFSGGPGTRIDSTGALTKQIAIAPGANTGVTIVLDRGGTTQRVGPEGNVIRATVPGSIIPSGGTADSEPAVVTVSFPAGAVSAGTDISVNPISAASLAELPPISGLGGLPAAPGTVKVGAAAALQLLPDGLTFPDGMGPIVDLPLPFTLAQLPAGSTVPVLFFDKASGQWVKGATATIVASSVDNDGLAVARFQVSHFCEYIIAFQVTFTFGNKVAVGAPVDFPVVTGKTYSKELINSLQWDAGAGGILSDAALNLGFESITGVAANYLQLVDVPPAQQWQLMSWSVDARLQLLDSAGNVQGTVSSRHGTRWGWFRTNVTPPLEVTTIPTIPSHLQGHVQGGGTGG